MTTQIKPRPLEENASYTRFGHNSSFECYLLNNQSTLRYTETAREISIPVAVVLERTIDITKKWVLPQWKVFAIVTGEYLRQQDQKVLIHEDEMHSRYYWGGMELRLYKDGSEGYWYNLLSDKPFLFVICDGEEGERDIEPGFITANQDEATGYMESDRMVLSIAMPLEIREILERYVVSHYFPEQKKKRKRQDWAKNSAYAKRQER